MVWINLGFLPHQALDTAVAVRIWYVCPQKKATIP